MSPYSVMLMFPDEHREYYGEEVFYQQVFARNPEEAQRVAAEVVCDVHSLSIHLWETLRILGVWEGHLSLVAGEAIV